MTRWLIPTVLTTALAFTGTICLYHSAGFDDLPDVLPVHWNILDQPDGFIARTSILPLWLMMPGMMVFLTVLTLSLPWLSPMRFQVEGFRSTYGYVMFLAVALMGYIHAIILCSAWVPGLQVGRWLLVGIFAFFALVGAVLRRVQPNFWIGIRTPWTLASPIVWERTHRFAGRVFLVMGLLGLVAAMAGIPLLWCFAALFGGAFSPVVYSLVVYKVLQCRGQLAEQTPDA